MMKRFLATLFLLCCFILSIHAQNLTIQPYLQDVAPHKITIMWETDANEESIVEWGLSEILGNQTFGIAFPSSGDAKVHEVTIDNLERFTKYYYRVRTGDFTSDIIILKLLLLLLTSSPFVLLR